MSELVKLKKTVDGFVKDPIAIILLKYSNLTDIQYESLIIDFLSKYEADKSISYKKKALLRSKKVSRGSFSRTLAQARKNVISAIYTILLLSYVGIFDRAPFDDYQILSEKLSEYAKIVQGWDPSSARKVLENIEQELMAGIRRLAEPKSLKIM